MTRKEKLILYVRETVDPEFDPVQQPLMQVLDSVSLLQLIMWIDQELGISLDLSGLSVEMFATVDTVVEGLAAVKSEA